MSIFRRSERLSLEALLELTPGRAPHVTWEAQGDEIRLTVRRADGPLVRLLARFFTLPAERTLVLDRDGAQVWRLADGRTRVRDIARGLAEAHGWPETQARDAVVRFLGQLSERRLVGFGSPGGAT